MTQKKTQERVIGDKESDTEDEKRQLALKVKEFYESAAPGLVLQGVGILRKFRISEEVLSKLTNLEDFSKNVLADSNLTVQDMEKLTAFMSTVEGKAPTMFKTAMREMVKKLPRVPGGGRPRVPDEKKKKVLRELLDLLAKGGTRQSAALGRVARNNSISKRTMQRIWAEHQKAPREGY